MCSPARPTSPGRRMFSPSTMACFSTPVGSVRPDYSVSESNLGKLNGYGGVGSPCVGLPDAFGAVEVTGSVDRSRTQAND